MPEPVTTIVTLQKLATNLVGSIKDGKDAVNAREILTLVSALQNDFFELQQKIIEVQKENAQLKQKTPTKSHVTLPSSADIDETACRILQQLSRLDGGRLTADDIASLVGLQITRTKYYLDKLVGARYLGIQMYYTGQPATYTLVAGGREYLVKNNLDV